MWLTRCWLTRCGLARYWLTRCWPTRHWPIHTRPTLFWAPPWISTTAAVQADFNRTVDANLDAILDAAVARGQYPSRKPT